MYGLQPEFGTKDIIYALCIEGVMVAFCVILIGYAVSELRRKRNPLKNFLLMGLGGVILLTSIYLTKLFIEG